MEKKFAVSLLALMGAFATTAAHAEGKARVSVGANIYTQDDGEIEVTTVLGTLPFLCVLSKPALGHWADRWRLHRPMLLGSLAVGLLSTGALPLLPSLPAHLHSTGPCRWRGTPKYLQLATPARARRPARQTFLGTFARESETTRRQLRPRGRARTVHGCAKTSTISPSRVHGFRPGRTLPT